MYLIIFVIVYNYYFPNFIMKDGKSDHQQQQQKLHDGTALQSESVEDSNNSIFADKPITMKCPFCLQNTVTEIFLKAEFTSYLISFILVILFPPIVGFILMIFAFQIASVKKHKCRLCERQLGSDGTFLGVLQDSVYSFNVGKSGIIVTKKILVNCLLSVLFAFLLHYKATRKHEKYYVEFVDTQWKDFIGKCSRENLKNSLIKNECRNLYQAKTFSNWTGSIMRIQDNRGSFKKYYDHAIRLYVKMDPPETSKPDIILSLDSYIARQYDQQLDKLHHGDEIIFNATIYEITEKTMRHMHLIDVATSGKHNKNVGYYLYEEEEGQLNKLRSDK